jgi:hypothetical protein
VPHVREEFDDDHKRGGGLAALMRMRGAEHDPEEAAVSGGITLKSTPKERGDSKKNHLALRDVLPFHDFRVPSPRGALLR